MFCQGRFVNLVLRTTLDKLLKMGSYYVGIYIWGLSGKSSVQKE